MAELPTTLVVNADDFGLSEGINRGIASAFHKGILRSASIMPNGQAFDDAVRIACESPGLGVGIHLSLVGERNVAGGGSQPSGYGAFVRSYAIGRIRRGDVQAEVEAQIERVLAAGLKPTHLDSHQHLHILPGIIDIVIRAARAAGIETIRVPLERTRFSGGRGLRRAVLSLMCRGCLKQLARAGMRHADQFHGLAFSGSMTEANLSRVLDQLGGGVNEIMCHPGFSDPATRARYQWNYQWDDEAAALTSEAVLRIVEERGIRLASFTRTNPSQTEQSLPPT